MLKRSDFDAHMSALVNLQNTLNGAEGELDKFYSDSNPSAARNFLTTMLKVASDLALLIKQVENDVNAMENANQ